MALRTVNIFDNTTSTRRIVASVVLPEAEALALADRINDGLKARIREAKLDGRVRKSPPFTAIVTFAPEASVEALWDRLRDAYR